MTFSKVLAETGTQMSVYVPRIVAAFVIFLAGVAVARALRTVVVRLLSAVSLSKLTEKTPVEHFLKNADLSSKLEEIVGSVVYWLSMLVVIQTTVGVLGLAPLSQILDKILSYIPNIISAVLVLFIGVLLAGLVESLVKGSIRSIDGKSALLIGKISSYLVITIASMAAVSELGIATEFITILFVGLVATLSLGSALALGLGGKDVVAKILDSWYNKTIQEISE
jgi:hypothetical protein